MPESDVLKATRTWLQRVGLGFDQADREAYDRLAEVVLNAMAAAGGTEGMAVELTVLMKVQAMLLAVLVRDQRSADTVDQYCAAYADALAAEVASFEAAIARDERRSGGRLKRHAR